MSMNTTVNTGNVPQIERSNPTLKPNARIISGDGGSSFQPETQVDLQNSIRNMLSALEKTAMGKGLSAEGLPEEVRRMVDSMLRNAFSLDASLGKGISDALQSQKFTLEQLGVLSKFLDQLSLLADENALKDLPESLKALLANLELFDGEGGKLLDGAALQKLAFQLLEGKKFDELPAALQVLLLQSVNVPQTGTPQQQEGMKFLKQLLQYFMPRPAEGESAPKAPSQGAPQNSANQAGAGSGGQTQGTQNTPNQTQNTPQSGTAGQPGTAAQPQQPGGGNHVGNAPQSPQNQQTQPGAPQPPNQGNAPAGTQTQANQNPQGTQQSGQQSAPTHPQSGAAASSTQPPNASSRGQHAESMPSQSAPGTGESAVPQTAAKARPPLQNTPQTMQLMKQMAEQLLQKEQLGAPDAALLRDFINGGKPVLEEQDAKQLQQLIRMSEDNMPPTIRLAAQQQNLPDLPKLWAFVQLANLTRLLNLSSERLRNSSKNVNDFASILKKSMQGENEVSGGQRSISFMTPLYMGDHEKCYPTYVHIYDDGGDGDKDGGERKETWLRMCLLTENIGAVELVFRLYEKRNVNLRIAFSAPEAAESFSEYIPELEKSFTNLPLDLTDVKVSAIGE